MIKSKLLLIALASMFFSFKAADDYKVDVSKSKIEWVARKVTGSHNGEIKLSSGVLNYAGSSLKGGNFIIDMNSITILDVQGETNARLLGHLKNDDFFAVDKFADAKFNIKKVSPISAGKINVIGDLTIKGITKSVSFPAQITSKNGTLLAVAKGVKVDRTLYDIKYRSKSFFESIGDKAIDNEFELNISLVATK
jgi:polyisoprenoid-binding protein YceI